MKKWIDLLKATFKEWSDDRCLRLGAALAFYTLGSLVPLLLVLTSIAAYFIQFTHTGQDIKLNIITSIANAIGQGPVNNQPSAFMGQLTEATAAREGQIGGSIISTVIGLATLLFAASGVFGQLYEAMNTIWNVPQNQRPQGIWAFVRSNALAFVLVVASAVVLLASTILTTALTKIIDALGLSPAWLVSLVSIAVQFLIIGVVFAAIFKYLPDIQVRWKDVLLGGIVTSALWQVGQYVLTIYFTKGARFSSYGIVGSILAFVFYIYYASQILFLGAEFTQVYARSYGSLVQAADTQATDATAADQPSAVERALAEARKRELLRKEQELAQAQRQTRGAAAASGAIGLLVGVLLGGAALVTGVARTFSRSR